MWIPPLTLDILMTGPPFPSRVSRFLPTGKWDFTFSPKSLLMPPFSVLPERSASVSLGNATVTLPFTDLRDASFFTSKKLALTEPLTLERSEERRVGKEGRSVGCQSCHKK